MYIEGANIFKIIFDIDFALATCLRHGKILISQSKDIVYNVSKYFISIFAKKKQNKNKKQKPIVL
jgi:hypothetical protein